MFHHRHRHAPEGLTGLSEPMNSDPAPVASPSVSSVRCPPDPSDVPARQPLLQGLPPILPDGPIRALVLGSFPSVASLETRQYYGHPQNRFWRVLAHCRVIDDHCAPYTERLAAVRRQGLAIWDLYGRVRRQGSGDDRIRDAEPNSVGALLAERGPFPILLNGRRAREWRQRFRTSRADVVELPSTSSRPRHWNTTESRLAAHAEWCAAMRSAGIPTPFHTRDSSR